MKTILLAFILSSAQAFEYELECVPMNVCRQMGIKKTEVNDSYQLQAWVEKYLMDDRALAAQILPGPKVYLKFKSVIEKVKITAQDEKYIDELRRLIEFADGEFVDVDSLNDLKM